MRSHKILDTIRNISAPVREYVSSVTSSSVTAITSFVSVSAAEDEKAPKSSVRMSATSHSASPEDIDATLANCVRGKTNPAIFRVLLDKKPLTSAEVAAYEHELVKSGKVEELDALAGKYSLNADELADELVKADNSAAFQRLLEAEDLENLSSLLKPESPITIVEASDTFTIEAAKAADRSTRIVRVDTTEGYAPSHTVIPVIRHLPHNKAVLSNNNQTLFGCNPFSRASTEQHILAASDNTKHVNAHC